MEVEKLSNLENYRKAFEIAAIGNKAVQQVMQENRRLGIPIVLSINNKIFYEMPDGTITTISPFKPSDSIE